MKASDNEYPSLLLVEGAAPATPAAGRHRLFVDTADDQLKLKDSAGAVTAVGAGGGGSAAGAPCWFEAEAAVALPASTIVNVPWHVMTDGVPAGTDAVISGAGDTTVEIVEPGLYMVAATAGYTGAPGLNNDRFWCYVVLNGDAAGPAYNLLATAEIQTDHNAQASLPTFPLQLAAGDTLSLAVDLEGGSSAGVLANAYLILTRIG